MYQHSRHTGLPSGDCPHSMEQLEVLFGTQGNSVNVLLGSLGSQNLGTLSQMTGKLADNPSIATPYTVTHKSPLIFRQ
jgi:hypothetical protein